jgi:hypothetical protein
MRLAALLHSELQHRLLSPDFHLAMVAVSRDEGLFEKTLLLS